MDRKMTRLTSVFSSCALALTLLCGGTFTNIALGNIPAALAQDQPGAAAPAGGHRPRMGEMLKTLNLSDAQKTQIRGIIADARKANADVTDRDQKRANMKAAYAKVETVLTPAQRDQLHAKMAAMRQDQSQHAQ
jgi:Spy/CpxP family protein refolding chaperone